jgi:hypothetical protein
MVTMTSGVGAIISTLPGLTGRSARAEGLFSVWKQLGTSTPPMTDHPFH